MKKIAITLSIIGSLFCRPVFAQQEAPTLLDCGRLLLGVPYVANTLERTDREELFTSTDELDCTTFVESAMAMKLSEVFAQKTEAFARNLEKIRYRGGQINGYTSRLHYVADWINDNIHKGIIEDITAIHSSDKDTIRLFYMSTHPDRYKHLKNSPENVSQMAAHEKRLTGQEFFWLPKHKLHNEGLSWIKDGDIIMLTTNIKGLDVSHMGIACYQKGKLHLLHASSIQKKVIIDSRTLRQQLAESKHVTGIRVLRVIEKGSSSL